MAAEINKNCEKMAENGGTGTPFFGPFPPEPNRASTAAVAHVFDLHSLPSSGGPTVKGQVREWEEGTTRRKSESNTNKPSQNHSGAAMHAAAAGAQSIAIDRNQQSTLHWHP
jgi:hypothetical protein